MSSGAVVCTFFKLPPDSQPLCRLTDIAGMFPPPLDYLNLVISAAEVERSYRRFGSGYKSNLDSLRSAAAQICQTFTAVIIITKNFTTISLNLVDLLAAGASKEEVTRHLAAVISQAESSAKELDKVCKETKSFADKISATEFMLKENSGSHGVRLGIDASQISDILKDFRGVVEECATSLEEYTRYFRETQLHYSHDETTPSQEEIDMIRERWLGLSKGLGSLNKALKKARRRLEKIPDTYRYDRVPSAWSDGSTLSDSEEGEDEEELEEEKEEKKEKTQSRTKSQTSSGPGYARQLLSSLRSVFYSRSSRSRKRESGPWR